MSDKMEMELLKRYEEIIRKHALAVQRADNLALALHDKNEEILKLKSTIADLENNLIAAAVKNEALGKKND